MPTFRNAVEVSKCLEDFNLAFNFTTLGILTNEITLVHGVEMTNMSMTRYLEQKVEFVQVVAQRCALHCHNILKRTEFNFL